MIDKWKLMAKERAWELCEKILWIRKTMLSRNMGLLHCIARRFFTVWATRGANYNYSSFWKLMNIIAVAKIMAPHSSPLAWKIPWMEERGGLQSMGSLGVGHDWAISLSCIGEGNGNPLQFSCLENPRDGGAWLAVVYGVTQSWTRLKRLSSSSSSSKT